MLSLVPPVCTVSLVPLTAPTKAASNVILRWGTTWRVKPLCTACLVAVLKAPCVAGSGSGARGSTVCQDDQPRSATAT